MLAPSGDLNLRDPLPHFFASVEFRISAMAESQQSKLEFKHFVAERDTALGGYVFLANRNSDKRVLVFPSTFNAIKNALPDLFEVAKNLDPKGDDLSLCEREIDKYKDNKLVVYVKRYRGRISVVAHQLYDRLKNGNYIHTKSVVEFDPEDDLTLLSSFIQEASEAFAAESVSLAQKVARIETA